MIGVLAAQYHALLQTLEATGALREADVDAKTQALLKQPAHDDLAVGLDNLREAIGELKKKLSN